MHPCPLTTAIFAYYDSGNEHLLAPVFDKLQRGLTAYTRRRLDVAAADEGADLVQDTLAHLLTLFRARKYQPTIGEGQVPGTGLLWAWAYRIHTRRFLNTLRRQVPSTPGREESIDLLQLADEAEAEQPLHTQQAAQLVRAVTRVVLSLPRGQRQCVVLVHYHNLTTQEAAEAVGLSLDTFRRHLRKAMQTLSEWAQRNPHLRPTPELYEALPGLDTGSLFRVRAAPVPESISHRQAA